jgi:hypothetical protein
MNRRSSAAQPDVADAVPTEDVIRLLCTLWRASLAQTASVSAVAALQQQQQQQQPRDNMAKTSGKS